LFVRISVAGASGRWSAASRSARRRMVRRDDPVPAAPIAAAGMQDIPVAPDGRPPVRRITLSSAESIDSAILQRARSSQGSFRPSRRPGARAGEGASAGPAVSVPGRRIPGPSTAAAPLEGHTRTRFLVAGPRGPGCRGRGGAPRPLRGGRRDAVTAGIGTKTPRSGACRTPSRSSSTRGASGLSSWTRTTFSSRFRGRPPDDVQGSAALAESIPKPLTSPPDFQPKDWG